MIRREFVDRAHICCTFLERLPQWFGRVEANARYIARSADLPMLVAWDQRRPIGFISLLDHNESSTEIFVMAVDPNHDRRGIGRALIAAAEAYAAERKARVVFVRTLGASHPDPAYTVTRRFYNAMDFVPVQELPDFWRIGTPSLLLAKFVPRDHALPG